MNHPPDSIPVLTEIVDDAPPDDGRGRTHDDRAELEVRLASAIHEHADELVHNACREMEALLLEQVSDRLKAELPALVARVLEEHFNGPASGH
ncbi:MAG: hypothetical protein EHM60_12060 [Lysobacterales bacterium]|nr:MAG: hypothetical protein EHM60_12060 [Xanthomonadales bacterium]